MSPHAVSKRDQTGQVAQSSQHQSQAQGARDVETTEHKSSANASVRFAAPPLHNLPIYPPSIPPVPENRNKERICEINKMRSTQAGLNLNLFGALSGALSSTKRKETHTAPDGSSHSVEDAHDKGNLLTYHAFPSSHTLLLLHLLTRRCPPIHRYQRMTANAPQPPQPATPPATPQPSRKAARKTAQSTSGSASWCRRRNRGRAAGRRWRGGSRLIIWGLASKVGLVKE